MSAPDNTKVQTFSLMNEDYLLTDYELRLSLARHQYRIKGGEYEKFTLLPSVTTVGKAMSGFGGGAGMGYARREIGKALHRTVGQTLTSGKVEFCLSAAERHRKASADRGSEIHDWMESYLRGDQPEILHEHAFACEAIITWTREWKINPLMMEQIVANGLWGYAGMLDLVAEYHDPITGKAGVGIFDLKTGANVYPENFAQMSAYVDALEWMKKADAIDEEARYLLHLPMGETNITVKYPLRPHEEDLQAFRSSLGIYDWNKKPKVKK